MKLKCVIFDLDGTLLDTTKEICFIFNQLLMKYSFPQKSHSFFKANIGNGVEDLLERSLPHNFSGNKSLMLEEVKKLYSKNLNMHSEIFDGVTDILNLLFEKNIAMGIVTNKMHHLAIRCVEEFFPNYSFKVIGAGFGYPKKPNPDSSLAIVKGLGFKPSETIFIGDSSVDMKTALSAKIKGIGVLWGNGTFEELSSNGASQIFDKVNRLENYLKKHLFLSNNE